MIIKVAAKGLRIPRKIYQNINERLAKVIQRIPGLKYDLSVFNLLIRKSNDNYYPQRHHHHAYQNFTNKKPSQAFYEGAASLELPKGMLYVDFKGKTLDECVNRGVDVIKKELQKYKDFHFPSESQYKDHSSLRKSPLRI